MQQWLLMQLDGAVHHGKVNAHSPNKSIAER
jgi:hypothetical protein